MKISSFLVIAIFTLSIYACTSPTLSSKSSDNMQFAIGRQCGWCAGKDSLTIDYSTTAYIYEAPCDDSDFNKKDKTNKADIDELVSLLDYEAFKQIEVNSCDVCFDGCDTWVWVKKDSDFHIIQFGASDSAKIQPILPFLTKLQSIRKKHTDKL